MQALSSGFGRRPSRGLKWETPCSVLSQAKRSVMNCQIAR